MDATSLRVEYLDAPLGIDERAPRFSWAVTSPTRGDGQTAYRIVVDGLWDSGRVPSNQTAQVVYDGPPLTSGQRCEWTVEVWDADGASTGPSAPAWFETGLLDA